ncbi:MAG: hypothetical protein ACT4TC_09095 [Myxococcaceae bacterium]
MVLDKLLLGLAGVSVIAGVLLGRRHHLGTLMGLAVGYGAAALLMPRWGVSLLGRFDVDRLSGMLLGTGALLALGGLGGWGLGRELSARFPRLAKPMPAFDATVGAASWLGCAAIASLALLGMLSLDEPAAHVLSKKLGGLLRDSPTYALIVLHDWVPEREASSSVAEELARTPTKQKVKIDYEAMQRDPRLRAAMADPVIRRAMETGSFYEVEERNRLLRPLAPQPAAGPGQSKTQKKAPRRPNEITEDMVPEGFTLEDFKGE